jgi:hypothetical protein
VAFQRRGQLQLIDDLDLQISALAVQLKRNGANHRYIPLLVTAPGIGSTPRSASAPDAPAWMRPGPGRRATGSRA